MERPVAGLANRRDVRLKTAVLHGDTSLRLSEVEDGISSPLLEAHPGSPVDISASSLPVTKLSVRPYKGSSPEVHSIQGLPTLSGNELDCIRGNDVTAEGSISNENEEVLIENDLLEPPMKRMQVAGLQPFYIPAKVPEQDEIHPESIAGDDRSSFDGARYSTAQDFGFERNGGVWILANPPAIESRTSLATTTTATSTLVDERRHIHGLSIDTSLASSAASMISSSAASIQSATTTTTDIYGWEEELDRKVSLEGYNVWEREMERRLPSGSRSFGPRPGGGLQQLQYKRGEGKRRSLLYRVLNMSGGSRRSPAYSTEPSPPPCDGCANSSDLAGGFNASRI